MLEKKMIFITGSSTAIGLECAKAHALENATVVLVRNGEEGKCQARALGEMNLGLGWDVSRDEELARALGFVLRRYRRLESHAAHTHPAIMGGMKAQTQALAHEYAEYGIALMPHSRRNMDSMLLRWAAEQPNPNGVNDYSDAIYPRSYSPEADVSADACVFLLPDKAPSFRALEACQWRL